MKRKNVIAFILSFIITLFMAIGTSFIVTNSFKLIEKHPFLSIVFINITLLITFEIIKMLFDNLDNSKSDISNEENSWLNKHPKTYVEATIENTYGYFYPVETNWYVHTRGKNNK